MRITLRLASAGAVAGLLAFASNASAQLTYFDADVVGYEVTDKTGTVQIPPNTTLVDGNPVPTTGDGSGEDGLWRIRENDGFGNKIDASVVGNILEARGQNGGPNTENVPTLKTTVEAPSADVGQDAAVYVLFWSDTSSWQVGSSLTNSNDGPISLTNEMQPVFAAGGDGSVDFDLQRDVFGTGHTFRVYDATDATDDEIALFMPNDSFLTTTDGADSGGPAGNRSLWAGFLGNVTLGDELTVYSGEGIGLTEAQMASNGGANHRTWLDGIAYGAVQPDLETLPNLRIPEPAGLALLSVGAVLASARRRRLGRAA